MASTSDKQRAINFAYGLVRSKAPASAELLGAIRLLRDTGCDADVLISQCEERAYERAYIETLPAQRELNAQLFPSMVRGTPLWYRPLTNLDGEPVKFVTFNPNTPDKVRIQKGTGRINEVDSGKVWGSDKEGLEFEQKLDLLV